MTSITELYRLLFGKTTLLNGNVIDMAEHGRAGGVASGQPFKFISSVNYSLQFQYDGNNNPIYIGRAKPGTATDVALWQIMKLTFDGNNNCTAIQYANGSPGFDFIWDKRSDGTYTYS